MAMWTVPAAFSSSRTLPTSSVTATFVPMPSSARVVGVAADFLAGRLDLPADVVVGDVRDEAVLDLETKFLAVEEAMGAHRAVDDVGPVGVLGETNTSPAGRFEKSPASWTMPVSSFHSRSPGSNVISRAGGRGDADLVGTLDLSEDVLAVLADGLVVGVEARREHVLGDAREGRATGAGVAGRAASARVTQTLRRRCEEDVRALHRRRDRFRWFLAVLVARRVAEDGGVLADLAGHLVQRLADGLALVVGDYHAGLLGAGPRHCSTAVSAAVRRSAMAGPTVAGRKVLLVLLAGPGAVLRWFASDGS